MTIYGYDWKRKKWIKFSISKVDKIMKEEVNAVSDNFSNAGSAFADLVDDLQSRKPEVTDKKIPEAEGVPQIPKG